MGVRGLQGFVNSTCPHIRTVVNLRELAEQHQNKHPRCHPTIVVDAMCCLRYWYTPESWVCSGQWREYFTALQEFVRVFTAVGIKLIFFFDGMVEQNKREEWVKRRLKNNKEISRIFHYIRSHRQQPGRNMFFIPSGLAIFTRFALKALGQETLCSLQEADYEVASYGLQNDCLGILGEDTDYLIYDTCPYFSISELSLDTLETVMLCRDKLCETLALRRADLPLLACLLGNDIVPEGLFESFRYRCLSSYTSVKGNFNKRGNIILAVADHIAKVLHLYQGEKKLEELLPLGPNEALFYKGLASYLLPGQESPWVFQKPENIITLNKEHIDPESTIPEVPVAADPESSKQEVPMYSGPESCGQAVAMYIDPEGGQEIPMCAGSEPKQEGSIPVYPESKRASPREADLECEPETERKHGDLMKMQSEVKRQSTMVSDPEILMVARTQHIQAESYLVYNIMTSREIECSNTLEDALDQALPSQAFIYRPVRQRVYSLLLGHITDGADSFPAVKEWFVYAGNPLQHPDFVRPLQMNMPGGTPNLKLLWLNQEPEVQAQRLDTLLACFDLSSASEELQEVEDPFKAFCCLLIYLFVQVDTLCMEDLHAFIAQALCLQGKPTVQLMDLQLEYVDSRAVQLGSLFVRGLTTLVLVNSACGFPWNMSDFMPWNVFDGKLFHQKYLLSEKGHSVEALVEQNRTQLTRFQALKSAVCKTCVKENRRITSRQAWRSHHTGRWSQRAPVLTERVLDMAGLAIGSTGETRNQEADHMSLTNGEDTHHLDGPTDLCQEDSQSQSPRIVLNCGP